MLWVYTFPHLYYPQTLHVQGCLSYVPDQEYCTQTTMHPCLWLHIYNIVVPAVLNGDHSSGPNTDYSDIPHPPSPHLSSFQAFSSPHLKIHFAHHPH